MEVYQLDNGVGVRNKPDIQQLMCRDESGVLSGSSDQENVRWRLVAEVRHRVENGSSERRGPLAAASCAGGATLRLALHRQRGLSAGHRDGARLRLRPSGHPTHEERRGLHQQM